MRRVAFLAGALLLAGCHRESAVTLDSDAAERNATAAKTLADLAAADAASRTPLPNARRAQPAQEEQASPPADDQQDAIGNE